ncbi:GNAT family N-acetyltransferase [Sphingomonas oleivorans]|uniref:GNAT family N-acetyltransferase n=1 Tax=Sphingomonas oleivorans TaxID=1735121 RepID=A0A2T5FZH1_9SPHN|nr:GNAT family N-acetyltransferase [Sphingomonas oleivorans]PTQ12099.1 GNAT family N-acetyltransferase [Sphingomonas oleivorans]
MTQLQFREAVAADLPAIVAMLADDRLGADREDASSPLAAGYIAAFEAIAGDANQHLIVAVDGEQVVGTLQLSFLPGLSSKGAWRGQIEAVRIVANRRGEGLGEQLIRWAIEACRRRGCATVQLTTDNRRADAHRFYERLGFKASHRGYKYPLP